MSVLINETKVTNCVMTVVAMVTFTGNNQAHFPANYGLILSIFRILIRQSHKKFRRRSLSFFLPPELINANSGSCLS